MTIEMIEVEEFNMGTQIKVIGVGGGGGNAVEHMIERQVQGVEFICANTDAQALQRTAAHKTIQLGQSGLGAGSKPDKGRESAEKPKEKRTQGAAQYGYQNSPPGKDEGDFEDDFRHPPARNRTGAERRNSGQKPEQAIFNGIDRGEAAACCAQNLQYDCFIHACAVPGRNRARQHENARENGNEARGGHAGRQRFQHCSDL